MLRGKGKKETKDKLLKKVIYKPSFLDYGYHPVKWEKEGEMPEEFEVITTQEQFNARLGERLKRESDKYSKQIEELTAKNTEYESQMTALRNQLDEANKLVANHKSELEERDKKIKAYEASSVKMRIAREIGLPYELAERLSGDTEDAIRTDAETLKGYFSTPKVQPLATTESGGESEDARLKNMLHKLREQ